MEIRPLRAEEVPTLVDDLWYPFAEEMARLDSYNRLADDPRERALAYRRKQVADDETAVFVADTGSKLVGYTSVVTKDPPPVLARGTEASLKEVYVDPDHRGEGIATDLMDRAEAWARDQNCERVGLSVNADNDTAQALYEKRGYSIRRHKMDRPLD